MGKKFWANIILCVFIGGVASVVLANINSALKPKGLLVADPEPSADAAAIMDKVILADYNLAENPGNVTVQWDALGIKGLQRIRDVWRQKDLGELDKEYSVSIARHGVMLLRLWPSDK